MKITAAAVALLALTSVAQADLITVQTAPLYQYGNDPIRDNRPISFAPFDFTSGVLTEATLRVTASYTPSFFNVLPIADTLGTSGVCLTDSQTFRVCATVPETGAYIPVASYYAGAPVSLDQTFDVTAAVQDGEFSLSYTFGTLAPVGGGAVDSTYYIGSAILTYFDPPLPVPEPNPLGIMVLALLSAGLIRRRCQ